MKLTELYAEKTIAEKQAIVDGIGLKLPHVRERTVRSWCLGNRNPKPFERKVIAKVTGLNESELFD